MMWITKKLWEKTTENLTNCSFALQSFLPWKVLNQHKPDSQAEQAQLSGKKGKKKVYLNQWNSIVPNSQVLNDNGNNHLFRAYSTAVLELKTL